MIRNRLARSSRPLLRRSPIGWAMACLVGLAAPAVASEQAVGQVSLLIGAARVVHMNGSSEPLRRGASILVGDRVETSANGHVHVRFIDNGAISIRPDSVLEVQAYRYDAEKPQANEVRLRMEQGTSRSISGAATEVDKSRFRLNTPIAAIGVRGTDFIVHTDDTGVRATVADGAIIVGALSAGCSAAALGPCETAGARLLSADMGRLMAEVRPGDRTTHVVPASSGLSANGAGGAEERAAALYAAESAARTAGLAAAEAKGFAPMRDSDRAAADLLAIAAAGVPDLNSASDLKAQLVWGRWSYSGNGTVNDNVSVPYVFAANGRTMTTAVDRNGALFRTEDPSNPGQLLQPDTDARVDFRLSRAQASFESGSKSEAASVDGGTLTLDFGSRTFATALALSSPTGGKAELRMAGDVATDGTFAVRDATQKVTGALSLDGKEAGYLFERSVAGGLFRGKTLWGR